MKNTVRQIAIAIILILICISVTYSIHLAQYREYTRSDANEYSTYPGDILLAWYEKLFVQVGEILGTIIIFLFCYLFFIGFNTFYTKYVSKYNISKVLVYPFLIWVIVIGIYSLTTSKLGQSFILEPFFGKKIYYGNYGNMVNSIKFKIQTVVTNKNVSSDEKEKEIQKL